MIVLKTPVVPRAVALLAVALSVAGFVGWARLVGSERARLGAMAASGSERMAGLDRALALHPGSARARAQRFAEHLRNDRLDPADADAERAARSGDGVDATLRRAWLRQRQGRMEESLALVDRARAMQPDEPAALVQRIALTYGLGRYDLARETAGDLNERSPGHPDALFVLGALAQGADRPDVAVFYYRQLLDALDRGEKLSLQTDLRALQDFVAKHGEPSGPIDGPLGP